MRYSGEFSGFKVAFGAGYSEFTDENMAGPLPPGSVKHSDFLQAGGYVQHIETGLFLHAAYGHEDNSDTRIGPAQLQPENGEHWYLKAGIRKKWSSLGATIVYGDYAEYLDQIGPAALTLGATGSTLRRYGGGIAQEIDAAGVRQAEKEVFGGPQNRCRARQRRIRIAQFGRRIDRAARLTGVAVLILGAALGAFALDEAVGQEHALLRVEELLHRTYRDQFVLAQRTVDAVSYTHLTLPTSDLA